ncbi:membrane hypothetical protein [uncultured Gammaproteobacteria bacterium]
MRRLMLVALIALVGLLPVNAYAQTQPQAQTEKQSDHRLLAVGSGAILGIVVFNMLTYPMGSVPFVVAPLAATPINIARGSRVLATLVGGGGGLLAHYLYTANSK